MPALTPGVVDVPLSPPNQIPSPTMGPLGRLEHLVDGQVTHYEPQYGGATGVTPAKIQADQRDAFISLPATAFSTESGQPATPPWTPPEILSPFGEQLVAVDDSLPRVFSGTSWRSYPSSTVISNILNERILRTSNKTIQITDNAWMNGVTCAVWLESVTTSTGVDTKNLFAIFSDDGTYLLTPSEPPFTVAGAIKVVTDGTYFYVFFGGGATEVEYNVYDQNGTLKDFTGTSVGSSLSGNWDVIASPTPSPNTGTILLASAVDIGTNGGVKFTSIVFNGTVTVKHSNTDNTIACAGPLSWITNDLGNNLAYLALAKITGFGPSPTLDPIYTIYGYEVSALAQVKEFNSGYTLFANQLDSIAGYSVVGGDGVDIVLSIGVLPDGNNPPANGPPVDPAFRFLKSLSVNRTGTVVPIRITQSVCQVSRAFKIDGQYFVYAYYQSGSGIGLLPKSENVTITDGDYFIGAAIQPIAVVAGDEVSGSPINVTNVTPASGFTVQVCPPSGTSLATFNIAAGDTATVVSSAGNVSYGIPDGTPLLRWTLTHIPPGGAQLAGARMVLSGASANNSTFDIVLGAGSQVFTPTFDIFGNPFSSSVTFTTAGTGQLQAMTAYYVSDLSAAVISNSVASFFTSGGRIVVVDGTTGGNSGNFLIKRISTPVSSWPNTAGNPTYLFGLRSGSFVWTSFVSGQATHNDVFTAVVTPNESNHWFFTNGKFDSTYVGDNLVVSANPSVPSNVGTFPITASDASNTITTGGATSLLSQIFGFPFPTVAVQLTTQVAYTFKLQSIAPNYTYQNALVSVQGADAANNGVYQIVQINADGSFIAQPTNSLSNQVNEAFFAAGSVTITIFFANNIQPESQPTWFIVPLAGSQPVVGRLENGLAYADWRIEIDVNASNLYPMSLATPAFTDHGIQICLPFRAENVTAATIQTTPAGEVNIVEESFLSTVGVKVFTLSASSGRAAPLIDQLMIPGPMATAFSGSTFLENGINVAPEAPFLISQNVAPSGQLALTLGGIYFVVAVFEYNDNNGTRLYSPPSEALQVNMSGTNTTATYGGRLAYPLDTNGNPISNVHGVTLRLSAISLYRSAYINGEPTTQHFKITNDLNINGLAPVSTLNGSGFSFPNSFTWNYIDQNPDAGLNANEILYTDKAFLPRYPAPPFRSGLSNPWKNRQWVIGYDDAVWMSGEQSEGDATWFNPAFRFPFSTNDKPLALAAVDDYLLVFCQASIWYIPAAQFPDATGGNGGLPTPVRLPFQNGSRNGFAETIREGAVYDSTAGGVWLITRQLENKWLSHNLLDTLTGSVIGLAVDKDQRLFVLQEDSKTICVYDGVPQCWYEWVSPTFGSLLSTYNGQACYQDAQNVNVVTSGATADVVGGATTGIPGPDITAADMIFGNVRGLKRVWEFQGVGTYRGPHNSNVILSYPEDSVPDSIYAPFTPDPDEPYIIPFNPKQEEASTYKVRIYPDFTGVISPGATFSLEMISAQVGLDPIGLNKRPQFVTLKAK